MIKRQKSVDSALTSNASSATSLESPPALVAPESSNCNKEVVAPIASNTNLRAINNGSIRNSAIKRFWTVLNQLLLWVTSASPNKQVGSRIQERSPTSESPQGPKEVAPTDTVEFTVLVGQNAVPSDSTVR